VEVGAKEEEARVLATRLGAMRVQWIPNERDREKTHVDAKDAEVTDVQGQPFRRAHEAHDFLLVGEVHIGMLVATADLQEIAHDW
jgi:hypothetical protein